MKILISLFCFLITCFSHADTMNNYMNIVNQIPQMELKADAKAQAWARSARTVLALTHETLAETLMQANELATKKGSPFFCLPPSFILNEASLSPLIVQTYNNISSQQSDKDKMTVSQVAWLSVVTTYPCPKS